MFSNKDLKNLIVPLFVEQFLLMLVGIADTFVVSFASEADVSGVSLVNSFNTVLVFLFTALSSGGAVIVSQYLGSKNTRKAEASAGQLLMVSAALSALLAGAILLFPRQLLGLLFGQVEEDVMAAGLTYLTITTWSLPALAVYDAGAALCRSTGRTSATMYISTAANVVNILGNCVGVFVLGLGAAGVAFPSLIARILSAAAVTAYCFRAKGPAGYRVRDIFAWDGALLKKILGIALPNGIENGVHQLVKVALSSMVALFGTAQIAANGGWPRASGPWPPSWAWPWPPSTPPSSAGAWGRGTLTPPTSTSKSSTRSPWRSPCCGTPWSLPSLPCWWGSPPSRRRPGSW